MGVRPLIRRTRTILRRMSADGETDENSIEQPSLHQSKSHPNSDSQRGASQAFGSQGARDSIPNRNTQRGVQDVEAVTLTWSKGTLIAMFIKYVGIHLGNVASRLICFQHLVPLLHQRVPTVRLQQSQPLRHQFVQSPFVVCSSNGSRRCLRRRDVSPDGKTHGCMGSSGRVPLHGAMSDSRIDYHGCLQ